MKRSKILLAALFAFSLSFTYAQVKNIDLVQTKGEFTTKNLSLQSGAYQFNIHNNNVDHEVGFVLVPKGKYNQADHIKTAYVKAPVAQGANSLTDIVNLEPGEYEYFCPLNPTPKYSITVSDNVETITLSQVPGAFKVKALTVTEGTYQFEIANRSVDHEVGFVLVPKGKYTEADHIKTAYVSSTAATGSSSLTGHVDLKAGEYEYFCPLNPTPKYSLTVLK